MYYDLTNSKTFDTVWDTLRDYYGVSEDVLSFAFDYYGRNEETLEALTDYYDVDLDELLSKAGIYEDEEEDEDE